MRVADFCFRRRPSPARTQQATLARLSAQELPAHMRRGATHKAMIVTFQLANKAKHCECRRHTTSPLGQASPPNWTMEWALWPCREQRAGDEVVAASRPSGERANVESARAFGPPKTPRHDHRSCRKEACMWRRQSPTVCQRKHWPQATPMFTRMGGTMANNNRDEKSGHAAGHRPHLVPVSKTTRARVKGRYCVRRKGRRTSRAPAAKWGKRLPLPICAHDQLQVIHRKRLVERMRTKNSDQWQDAGP